jgi:hypothetical protein
MVKFLQWLKKEIIGVLPSVLFFFVGFNLIRWTTGLVLNEHGIQTGSFVTASVGALIVGKVLLVVDLFPVINAFGNKPLIYNTVWKSFLYSFAALLFRVGEDLVPLAIHHKSLAIGFDQYVADTDWPFFWAIQIWVVLLMIVFVIIREFARAVGVDQTRSLFFGIKPLTGSPCD